MHGIDAGRQEKYNFDTLYPDSIQHIYLHRHASQAKLVEESHEVLSRINLVDQAGARVENQKVVAVIGDLVALFQGAKAVVSVDSSSRQLQFTDIKAQVRQE